MNSLIKSFGTFCAASLIIGSYLFVHAKELQKENLHRYMWANYKLFQGDGKESFAWFQKALQNSPSEHVYKGYIHFLARTGNLEHILQLMPKVQETFKNDPEIQLIFAKVLEKNGQQQKADELVIKLNQQFPNDQKIAFVAAQTYINRKELENALSVIDSFLNKSSRRTNNFIFHFLKSQIYVQMDDAPKALASLKTTLKLYPHFDKGWMLYGLLHEQMGILDNAIKGYTNFLQTSDQPSKQIEQHLLNLIFKQKMIEQHNENLFLDKNCFEQALILFKQKSYAKALDKIDECIQDEPKNDDAKLLKVQIYSSMHRYSRAAKQVSQWLADDHDNPLWYSVLHLLGRAGLDHTKTLRILKEIDEKHPQSLMPTLYLADLYARMKDYPHAIEYNKKALEHAECKKLKNKLSFHLALLYWQEGQYGNVREVLEEDLKNGSFFAPSMNLLAYYYATKGKNIPKAQTLISKVLKIEKNNPHYYDTQAVILYKKGHYKKAANLLEQLIAQAPDDHAIAKNLGKTYFKMGKKNQASITLHKALELAHNNQDQKKCSTLIKRWNLIKS